MNKTIKGKHRNGMKRKERSRNEKRMKEMERNGIKTKVLDYHPTFAFIPFLSISFFLVSIPLYDRIGYYSIG